LAGASGVVREGWPRGRAETARNVETGGLDVPWQRTPQKGATVRTSPHTSPDIGPRMREVYDRIAPAFAARNAVLPAGIRDAGPSFLTLVHKVAGGRRPAVVEAGCGPGRDMAWLEAAGAAVIGFDLSAGMLAQARGAARGPLVQADLRRPPLAAGRFHGAWCNAALLHLPKAEVPGALAGLRRLLVPGGGLFVSVQVGAGEGWERGAYGDPDAERFFARYTAAEARALLEATGFAVHEVTADRGDAHGAPHWMRLLAARTPLAGQDPG
jgi:SAM-dependent methyltransferase